MADWLPAEPDEFVLELGPGNGNLAACFLSHLKVLDQDGTVYPRIRYMLVDWEQSVLDAALAHPELASHRRCARPLETSLTRRARLVTVRWR